MSKPEETNAGTPSAELSPEDRFMRDALALGPRPVRPKRRKALRIEVSQRTFDAVKANPGDLKLLAKDRHGDTVIERPARPRTGTISEDEVGREEYKRIRRESIGRPRPDPDGPVTRGPPPDQYWTAQRTWTGEVRYRPDDGSRNPFVTHVYDVFDVLRED